MNSALRGGEATSAPAKRRRRYREEMAQEILDTAREVMREEGVSALNLNEIARRLGVKPPALYKYFQGKQEIYDRLFRLGHQTFRGYLAHMGPATGGFWDTWKAVMEAQLQFAHDWPELFDLAFERPVPGFVPSEESMAVAQSIANEGEVLVKRGMESGEIRADLPLARVRDLLFAVTGGLSSAHRANEPETAPEKGRFGGLVGPLIQVLKTAWCPDHKSS